VRSSRGTAALALAAAVTLAAGCGGGDKAKPPVASTVVEPTTTTTVSDARLRELLLVAADVPEFKERPPSTEPEDEEDPFTKCATDLPAAKALENEPEAEGATFVRAPEDAVEVSSEATGTTPDKAEAAVTELLEPKKATCFETALRAALEKAVPAGAQVTPKATVTKASVAGADQAVLLSIAATVKAEGKTTGYRVDLVFLRRGGDIVIVFYSGPTNLTSVAERQRIVAAVSKKLGGGTSSTSTTSSSSSGGSSTSVSGGGSSTTRRSTTTTKAGSTSSSRASTSTTRA